MGISFWEKILLGRVLDLSNKTSCDFTTSNAVPVWSSFALGTGTLGYPAGDATHIGVMSYVAHVSNANSGYAYRTNTSIFLLSGGEKTTLIFKTPTVFTNVLRRFGFHDTIDHNAPIDGIYVEMTAETLTGHTSNSSTRSDTGTSFSLIADTYYRVVVELNALATLVTYTLYADNSNTVLWRDTLATNIPTGAGRYTSHGDICTLTTATGVADTIGYIDYMDMVFPKSRQVI